MQTLLCREFGLKKADAEVDRLTFCLVGMASVYFHGGGAAVEELAPRLIRGKAARAEMVDRLVGYAVALIESDRQRRSVTSDNKKQATQKVR
jgi:hypothetical protein